MQYIDELNGFIYNYINPAIKYRSMQHASLHAPSGFKLQVCQRQMYT